MWQEIIVRAQLMVHQCRARTCRILALEESPDKWMVLVMLPYLCHSTTWRYARLTPARSSVRSISMTSPVARSSPSAFTAGSVFRILGSCSISMFNFASFSAACFGSSRRCLGTSLWCHRTSSSRLLHHPRRACSPATGGPEGIRTLDRPVKSRTLYLAKLQALLRTADTLGAGRHTSGLFKNCQFPPVRRAFPRRQRLFSYF